jgi:exonuclease VII large subunit
MAKRNREINIFNFSMLDVITGAMGAYLAVMVVLLPYYQKKEETTTETSSMSQEELRRTLEQAQQQVRQSQQEVNNMRQSLAKAQSELEKAKKEVEETKSQSAQQAKRIEQLESEVQRTFMLIHIQWAVLGPDVDLHVIDPKGNHFSFKNRTAPGSSGNLSVDSTVGPGNEVFVDSHAIPGDYKVFAHLYNTRGQTAPIEVSGLVIFRDGTLKLPSLTLQNYRPQTLDHTETGKDPSQTVTTATPMQLIAVLRVDAQGSVRMVPPNSAH